MTDERPENDADDSAETDDDVEIHAPDGRPLYESQRLGFRPLDEPEFDDEPPGAYLAGLEIGFGAAAWGAVVLSACVWGAALATALVDWTRAVAFVGVLAAGTAPAAFEPPWAPPLELLWRLLPVVATAGFLLTLFIRVNQESGTKAQRRAGTTAVWLHLLALVLWCAARWGAGIGFAAA